MFFQIDFQNGLAVYDQVVRQVKFAVAAKLLAEGSMVPSVRELAGELAINPNTVARAYRQLQDDGVLSPVRGTGLAVAAGACGRCQSERLELVRHPPRTGVSGGSAEPARSRDAAGHCRSAVGSH